LRRFLRVRAPRCEWPGCGARAACCDQDHDLAHPYGPTCGCNLGTLCRRHHRVKQTGWTKTRTPTASAGPAPPDAPGSAPTSTPHPPHPPDSPAPPPHDRHEHLSPLEHEDLLWDLDPSDPLLDGAFTDRRLRRPEPDHDDHVLAALLDDLTRWTLDLDDPYVWCA
jgi:hypothetical protein